MLCSGCSPMPEHRWGFSRGLGGHEIHLYNETYPIMTLSSQCHPEKKKSVSHGSSSARAPVVWSVGWESMKIGVFIVRPLGPICRSQLQKARVVMAGFDLTPCGGGLLWVHQPACFPTGRGYIIMILPVVLWIPDLKGQRPELWPWTYLWGCGQWWRRKNG